MKADYINIAIRSVIDTLIIGGLFFYLNPAGGDVSLAIFLTLFPLATIISVSTEVIYERLKGDITQEGKDDGSAEKIVSSVHIGETLWLGVACCAIVLALLVALPLYWLMPTPLPGEKAPVVWLLGAVCLAVIAASSLTVRIVGDRISGWYAARLAMPQVAADKEASDRLMVINYFLPWAGVAMLMTGLLSWGYFSPRGDYIEVEDIAFSCGGTAYIIALWIAYITKNQALIDINASLLRFEEDDNILGEGKVYFLIHAWSGCIIVAIFIISRFFSWGALPPFQAVIIDTLVAGLSAIAGALGGLIRARTRLLSEIKN